MSARKKLVNDTLGDTLVGARKELVNGTLGDRLVRGKSSLMTHLEKR